MTVISKETLKYHETELSSLQQIEDSLNPWWNLGLPHFFRGNQDVYHRYQADRDEAKKLLSGAYAEIRSGGLSLRGLQRLKDQIQKTEKDFLLYSEGLSVGSKKTTLVLGGFAAAALISSGVGLLIAGALGATLSGTSLLFVSLELHAGGLGGLGLWAWSSRRQNFSDEESVPSKTPPTPPNPEDHSFQKLPAQHFPNPDGENTAPFASHSSFDTSNDASSPFANFHLPRGGMDLLRFTELTQRFEALEKAQQKTFSLPTREELIAEAQKKLRLWKIWKDNGKPKATQPKPDIGAFALQVNEVFRANPPTADAFKFLMEHYESTQKQVRKVVKDPSASQGHAAMTQVAHWAIEDHLSFYLRDNPNFSDSLMGQGGNCQVQTCSLLTYHHAAYVEEPEYIQFFKDHMRAVTYTASDSGGEVWDPMSHKAEQGVRERIWDEHIYYYSFLKKMQGEDLLSELPFDEMELLVAEVNRPSQTPQTPHAPPPLHVAFDFPIGETYFHEGPIPKMARISSPYKGKFAVLKIDEDTMDLQVLPEKDRDKIQPARTGGADPESEKVEIEKQIVTKYGLFTLAYARMGYRFEKNEAGKVEIKFTDPNLETQYNATSSEEAKRELLLKAGIAQLALILKDPLIERVHELYNKPRNFATLSEEDVKAFTMLEKSLENFLNALYFIDSPHPPPDHFRLPEFLESALPAYAFHTTQRRITKDKVAEAPGLYLELLNLLPSERRRDFLNWLSRMILFPPQTLADLLQNPQQVSIQNTIASPPPLIRFTLQGKTLADPQTSSPKNPSVSSFSTPRNGNSTLEPSSTGSDAPIHISADCFFDLYLLFFQEIGEVGLRWRREMSLLFVEYNRDGKYDAVFARGGQSALEPAMYHAVLTHRYSLQNNNKPWPPRDRLRRVPNHVRPLSTPVMTPIDPDIAKIMEDIKTRHPEWFGN